jgi:microcystin-dependent protein
MGLETGTYVSDLNPAWPLGTDLESQGDDHIRLIKAVLKATFPGQNAPLTPSFVLPVGLGPLPFAGANAPPLWLMCFGQAISRTVYSALYAAIGTAYGAGDGSTTFNVPDLRGRVPFGVDSMGGTAAGRLTGSAAGGINANARGVSGGEQQHTVTWSEMPVHAHSMQGHQHQGPDHYHDLGGHTHNTPDHYHSAQKADTGQVGGSATRWISGGSGGMVMCSQATQGFGGSTSSPTGNTNTAWASSTMGTMWTGGPNIGSTDNQGSGWAHNTVPPGVATNYIIFAGV